MPISRTGKATFASRCTGCPLRARCTSAKQGRKLSIHPHHDVLHAARQAATQPDWQHTYTRYRPMVERSIAWLVAHRHRRVRYRGIARNQLWLDHRVAAVNLRQLIRAGLVRDQRTWAIT